MLFIKRPCLFVLLFFVSITNVYAVNKINVFVSILPQQYFVQQVGGENVDVHVMVGPGQNPATYEPTPQQMTALTKADIYFSIGVPFEKAWINKVKEINRDLKFIECCKSLSDLEGHKHHDHDDTDPHVWTNPRKVIQIVGLIEKSLTDIDYEKKDSYKKLAAHFINELNEVDNAIKTKLSPLKQRNMIVSHPSWSYFADEYGLKQISIEQGGKEIQAKSMVKLIKLAKENNIKAVFVQSQFNAKAARTIAREIDATVIELDPLAFNYIENMNDVTNKIVKGLSYE
jgi:zinc transport system substrate-binding protein